MLLQDRAQQQQGELAAVPQRYAVRRASRADRRVARKASVLSRILTGTSTTSHASTASGAERICAASSCRPMVTKNTPDNTSRNGLRWLSMWCRKSLSPSTIRRGRPQGGRYADRVRSSGGSHHHAQETSTNDSSWPRRATQPSRPCNRRRGRGPLPRTTAAAHRILRAAHARSSATRRAQIASKGQQGHAGQVLKDQHGDGTASVAGGELAWSASCRLTSAVDDMAAAVPSSAALWRAAPATSIAGSAAGPRRSSAERPPSAPSYGRARSLRGEFQSDHEQQQRHAQLGQKAQRLPGAITPMTEGPSTTPTEIPQQGGHSERRRRHRRRAASRQQD